MLTASLSISTHAYLMIYKFTTPSTCTNTDARQDGEILDTRSSSRHMGTGFINQDVGEEDFEASESGVGWPSGP